MISAGMKGPINFYLMSLTLDVGDVGNKESGGYCRITGKESWTKVNSMCKIMPADALCMYLLYLPPMKQKI